MPVLRLVLQASLLLLCFRSKGRSRFRLPPLCPSIFCQWACRLGDAALMAAVMARAFRFQLAYRSSPSIFYRAPAASYEKPLVNFGRVGNGNMGDGLAVGPFIHYISSQLYI